MAAGQICWNYNLKDGCQLSTSGKPPKCARGLHMCACCHKAGHSAVVCREAKKGSQIGPTEPPKKCRKDTLEDSGGEKEEYEAAFCEDALQEASISESEMDMEMDETPKGTIQLFSLVLPKSWTKVTLGSRHLELEISMGCLWKICL